MMELKGTALTFSDIQIEDQYSEIASRSKDVDITTDMGKFKLRLPVVASNMPDICEYKMAIEMYLNGGLGILHRFMSIEENIKQFKAVKQSPVIIESLPEFVNDTEDYLKYCCGVSMGVGDSEKERFDTLYQCGAKIFCIDIAHGDCKQMKDMIQWIKSHADDIVLIAGNIATARAALNFAEWGVNIAKCGIGPGSVCRTRSNTGVGKPQFSALKEVYEALKGIADIKIISDGGIREAGDVGKAMIYADAIMVGAVLAGTAETPGNVYPEPGTNLTNRQYYKMYGGSASAENKRRNGQEGRFVEGEMKKVPFKGHAKYLLREIEDGLKSTLSYNGSKTIKHFKETVKWYRISSGGQRESKF